MKVRDYSKNDYFFANSDQGYYCSFMFKINFQKIKWVNLVFFVLSPFVAVIGTIWVIKNGGIHWATWILTLGMLYACGLSITAGYHRLFSHRTYQASWPARLFFILFGAGALEGSARWWCQEHRDHHRYVDTEKDPYGINKGFWYAHIGWLLTTEHDEKRGYGNIKDLKLDPLIRVQDKYYAVFSIFMGFLFPMAVAALWGDPWGGLFIAGFARIVFNHHATFCINSLCHYLGKQTYSDKHSAKDSWIAALITYGEGYHNFHHEFQSDYRNGVRSYHWDPSKWLIQIMAGLKMARNLRKVSWQRILNAKLMMDQKRAELAMDKPNELLVAAREHLQQAHERFLLLKREYQKIKKEKMYLMANRLEELRAEMKQSRKEFKLAMAQWQSLLKTPVGLAA